MKLTPLACVVLTAVAPSRLIAQSFGAPSSLLIGGVRQVKAGDVNGDGLPDVAGVSASVNPGIALLPGIGRGAVGAPVISPGGVYPFGLALSDADANGRLDALTGDNLHGSMRVFAGNGAGGFALTQTVATGAGASDVEVADVDLDGHVDAVCVNARAGTIAVHLQIPAMAPSAAAFGASSPGCVGRIGLGVNTEPRVNTPSFAYTLTHAPKSSLGLLLATNVKDSAGSDPFGIGILLHSNPFLATEIYFFDVLTEGSGVGRTASPIPNDPFLAGKTLAASALFLENASDGLDCGLSPFGLVSSRGLDVVIQS